MFDYFSVLDTAQKECQLKIIEGIYKQGQT